MKEDSAFHLLELGQQAFDEREFLLHQLLVLERVGVMLFHAACLQRRLEESQQELFLLRCHYQVSRSYFCSVSTWLLGSMPFKNCGELGWLVLKVLRSPGDY